MKKIKENPKYNNIEVWLEYYKIIDTEKDQQQEKEK